MEVVEDATTMGQQCSARPTYHVIRAAGNGSCLFISLRLGLELATVMNATRPITAACLDGYANAVLQSAEELRAMIVQWYEGHLDKRIVFPQEDVAGTKALSRGDMLAIEMVRHGRDVPESGKDRDLAIGLYIAAMKGRAWGSTPEYVAFSMMSKLSVKVFQPRDNQIMLVDSIVWPNSKYTILLLFDGQSHYDLLVDNPNEVQRVWPHAKIVHAML